MGTGSCNDFSRACLLVGGSWSCCDTFATARDRFEPELFRLRCGELVALGMLIKGCLREVVAMLPNVSCGEGGTSTAAAMHEARLFYRSRRGGSVRTTEREDLNVWYRRGGSLNSERDNATLLWRWEAGSGLIVIHGYSMTLLYR